MPRANGYSAKNCEQIAYYYVYKHKHTYIYIRACAVYVPTFELLITRWTVWTLYGIYRTNATGCTCMCSLYKLCIQGVSPCTSS